MPSDPLRLQVLDRFETVLASIEAGTNYFYTPHIVSKQPIKYELAKNGNLYQTFVTEDATGPIVISGRENFDETYYISVEGVVHDRADLGTKIEKSIRDIRYVIDQDSKSSTAGTLGVLGVQVRIDESPEIAYFSEKKDDFAVFEQRFRVQITGDFGVL
jgi:hypothetical protein